MFMGNDEIKNTLSLTKIKLGNIKTDLLKILLIIFMMFIAGIFPTILQLFKYKDLVADFRLPDLSSYLFISLFVVTISFYAIYKRINDYYSVYPQTNSSRFLSTQLTFYLWWIVLSFFALILYLSQYILFRVIVLFNENIVIALKFDFGFAITGYFVYLLYGLLVITFISFIAALIHKFNTIAVISLLIIFALLINGNTPLLELFNNIFGFLTKEEYISIFFLKGIITLLILFVASFFINKYTCYYKIHKKYSKLIVIAVGIILILIVSIIRFSLAPEESVSHLSQHNTPVLDRDSHWLPDTISIDISDYDDANGLSVISNINENTDNMIIDYRTSNLYGPGDEIVIYYRFPLHITNDYDLTKHMNCKINASLEDNILNITYSYDKNIKVVFISPYSIIRQFDKYKDKDLYTNTPLLITNNSHGSGFINITIE